MNHAETIQQLGGNRFAAMTGAAFFKDGETLIVKFKGSRIANIMYISLTVFDTYRVKIAKFRGMDVKTVSEIEGLYSDQLREYFTKVTGLYTNL